MSTRTPCIYIIYHIFISPKFFIENLFDKLILISSILLPFLPQINKSSTNSMRNIVFSFSCSMYKQYQNTCTRHSGFHAIHTAPFLTHKLCLSRRCILLVVSHTCRISHSHSRKLCLNPFIQFLSQIDNSKITIVLMSGFLLLENTHLPEIQSVEIRVQQVSLSFPHLICW